MRSLEQVNIRTNVRTYVRTYSHTYVRDRPYIPSTTLLCEGIKRKSPEIILKLQLWDFFQGIQERVRNSCLKRPSVFEPLTIYCILLPCSVTTDYFLEEMTPVRKGFVVLTGKVDFPSSKYSLTKQEIVCIFPIRVTENSSCSRHSSVILLSRQSDRCDKRQHATFMIFIQGST